MSSTHPATRSASARRAHASLQAGVGVDYPITRKAAARVELDYRMFLSSTSNLGRQVRVLTGLVVTVF